MNHTIISILVSLVVLASTARAEGPEERTLSSLNSEEWNGIYTLGAALVAQERLREATPCSLSWRVAGVEVQITMDDLHTWHLGAVEGILMRPLAAFEWAHSRSKLKAGLGKRERYCSFFGL